MTSNIRQYSSSNLEPFCAVEDKSNIELVDFNFQVCDIECNVDIHDRICNIINSNHVQTKLIKNCVRGEVM